MWCPYSYFLYIFFSDRDRIFIFIYINVPSKSRCISRSSKTKLICTDEQIGLALVMPSVYRIQTIIGIMEYYVTGHCSGNEMISHVNKCLLSVLQFKFVMPLKGAI